ncbi:hypothetical protein ACWGCW_19670 [Streptomyces sp. NPDC054933]
MRSTFIKVALVAAAAALLTGCGSGHQDTSVGQQSPGATSSTKPTADAKGQQATHEVTFEVQGKGQTQIYYTTDTNHSEQVPLPWKKTTKVTLVGAELQVGVPVSIIPGTVQGSDGRFRAAPCVIAVDGKTVADNQGGKSDKGCQYTLK